MRVNGISSVKSVSGSGTSANGFIILQMVIAEGQIVHRALTRGHGTQCAKQRVTNRLTGLYIAGNHGGGRFGREQTTVWNFNMDGFEAPLIHRNIRIDHTSENIKNSRATNRAGRVEIIVHLRAGAGEVDIETARRTVHRECDADNGAAIHIDTEGSIVQAVNDLAYIFFRIVLH